MHVMTEHTISKKLTITKHYPLSLLVTLLMILCTLPTSGASPCKARGRSETGEEGEAKAEEMMAVLFMMVMMRSGSVCVASVWILELIAGALAISLMNLD